MDKKTTIFVLLVSLLSTGLLKGQAGDNCVVNTILSGYSARMFTSEPVSDNAIDLILKCGIKAPSARNSQLWKFTVVRDTGLIKELIPKITPGNVLIVVSGLDPNPDGINVYFDCALATENMFVAAQGLGLGGHIYTGPVKSINETKLKLLELPEGYKVISILRVGNIDSKIDAVSAASARKSPAEVVNYK
jgi:nitroreductase